MNWELFATKYLPWIVATWVGVMLLSLYCGWLDSFFWAAQHAKVQGIDYFALPKSFLNLLEHRSPYDSWNGVAYGPYATWYLAHPLFSITVMPFFAFLSPWLSYIAFVFFSLGIMLYCAFLYAKEAIPTDKNVYYALFLLSFPVYWMFYVGNMHAPLVLSIALILLGIYELAYVHTHEKAAHQKLFAGLIISFFTKPVVILLIPALFFAKETRKTLFWALVAYAIGSCLVLFVPFINPESISWQKRLTVLVDIPFIKENLNIYKNQYVLNEYMKDNIIHWLNLIAQSGYRFNHIENFSFPVFLDTLFGKELPNFLYTLPILFGQFCSVFLLRLRDKNERLQLLLLITLTSSVSYFLSYNTVWEYQYASMLPVVAMIYRVRKLNLFSEFQVKILLSCSLFYYLPSFYCLLDKTNMDLSFISMVRVSKSLATLSLFLVLAYTVVQRILKHISSEVFVKTSQTMLVGS